ncbi:MAG: hypothetical protein ACXADA_11570 [Candidatus Hodarchaeales archaeon]|jgi:hypothetical protein
MKNKLLLGIVILGVLIGTTSNASKINISTDAGNIGSGLNIDVDKSPGIVIDAGNIGSGLYIDCFIGSGININAGQGFGAFID